MKQKTPFTTVNVALTGVFCALWIVLNLTLGPLSFQMFRLPILHDFAAYFTLLLAIWATGRSGTASLVGVLGSAVALLLGGPPVMVSFAASSLLFDVLMSANKHRVNTKLYGAAVAIVATVVSAYFNGLIIGFFFTQATPYLALTFWGGWHLVGGLISVAVTLPTIRVLEKAGVKDLIVGQKRV